MSEVENVENKDIKVEEVIVEVEEDKEEVKVQEPTYTNSYPLSGIGTNEEITQRPFAVMINNHPKARPQTGLNEADIVYEVLAEGYITRFLAIYQSEFPKVLGPIRSARDYYINLSKGYDSIYVAYGGSPEALKMLDDGVTDFINGIKLINGKQSFEDDHFYFRSKIRKAPHNVYITSGNLVKGAKAHQYKINQEVKPIPFLTKEQIEVIQGEAATEFRITYSDTYHSSVRYLYNEAKEKYLRFNGEKQTVDFETEQPLMLDNILIIETPHKVIDNAGRRNINLQKGGKGYLMQKGVYQEIEWKNIDGRILPFKEGQAVPFVPGKTWINIVPTYPGLDEAVSFIIKVD